MSLPNSNSAEGRMTVWMDLCHTPQYNFYRNTILRLSAEGHVVLVTVLDRGRLAKIVRSELGDLPGVSIFTIGKHGMTKASAIWQANVVRNFKLWRWIRGRRIDVGLSNGYAVALFGWLRGFRTYSFDDDPQTVDYRPKLWFNTQCNFCLYGAEGLSPKAHVLPVLKEWAYLAPGYFKPSQEALEPYGLAPRSYAFLREVSVGTVNYAGQDSGAVLGIAGLIPKGIRVVLSLEEKSRRSQYPSDWILLQEPVGDIHSLIYYSAFLVSSGDSMAREAALMGVPSYYLGVRYNMPANRAAAEVASLASRNIVDFGSWISGLSLPGAETSGAVSQKGTAAGAEGSVTVSQKGTAAGAEGSVTVSQKGSAAGASVSADDAQSPSSPDLCQAESRRRIAETFIDINEYIYQSVIG